MTNLDAMIKANNGIGGTIHQFNNALRRDTGASINLANCDLHDARQELLKGDYDNVAKWVRFISRSIMVSKNLVLQGVNGKETFQSDIDVLEES